MAEGETRDLARGERIRDLVEEGAWSVTHLAREIGVDRGRIYDWMKGGPIRSNNVSALAEALGTTRAYLLSAEDPGPLPTGVEEAVRQILGRLTEADARQVQIQSDLAQLTLAVEGLRADLRSSREHGGQAQGGPG